MFHKDQPEISSTIPVLVSSGLTLVKSLEILNFLALLNLKMVE